jgi:hypothetical protein
MTILKEAESAAAAASKLFRMPVPTNEYEGTSLASWKRVPRTTLSPLWSIVCAVKTSRLQKHPASPASALLCLTATVAREHVWMVDGKGWLVDGAAKQELGYRMDMALAALKFFNTQYS